MSRVQSLLRKHRAELRAAAVAATTGIWLFSVPPVQGNDIGGIIAWQPGIEDYAREIAAAHCARWDKYAVITSVHPWYGDYIGFACRRPGRWGPVGK
jgi:hypothetical protein